ncbi:hypothetical protein C8024_07540 [Sphingopyxis sp. BSNA05]|nr:hypothetical protein [Sphingopyxis sp. BSNA05]
MLREVKLGVEYDEETWVGGCCRPGIFGDQITKDALLFTAGPMEALSRMAAERKEAKAAARRL